MTRVLRRLRAAARASHRAGSSLARNTRRARWRPSASWTEGEAPERASSRRWARCRAARVSSGVGAIDASRASSPPPVDDDRARDSPAATSRDAIHARSVLSTNATSADAIVRPRGAVEWEKMTNSARALSPPTTSTLRRTATRKCSANLTVYRRSNRPYLGSAPRFFREADGGSRTSRVPLVTSRRWCRAGRARPGRRSPARRRRPWTRNGR